MKCASSRHQLELVLVAHLQQQSGQAWSSLVQAVECLHHACCRSPSATLSVDKVWNMSVTVLQFSDNSAFIHQTSACNCVDTDISDGFTPTTVNATMSLSANQSLYCLDPTPAIPSPCLHQSAIQQHMIAMLCITCARWSVASLSLWLQRHAPAPLHRNHQMLHVAQPGAATAEAAIKLHMTCV